jgi:serine protease SohB
MGRAGHDRVVVRLASPGGAVDTYGLAADQLARLRFAGFYVTVCVDKMAASGGYLMAAVAHRIVAAPFAYIGSIGVVTEFPNFHRLLQRYDIDYKTLTAGESKRTASTYGAMNKNDEENTRRQLERVHLLFQRHVARYRPWVDLDVVATGDTWSGTEAHTFGLIDDVMTSDHHLEYMARDYRLLHFTPTPTIVSETTGFMAQFWEAMFSESNAKALFRKALGKWTAIKASA